MHLLVEPFSLPPSRWSILNRSSIGPYQKKAICFALFRMSLSKARVSGNNSSFSDHRKRLGTSRGRHHKSCHCEYFHLRRHRPFCSVFDKKEAWQGKKYIIKDGRILGVSFFLPLIPGDGGRGHDLCQDAQCQDISPFSLPLFFSPPFFLYFNIRAGTKRDRLCLCLYRQDSIRLFPGIFSFKQSLLNCKRGRR